MLPLRPKSIRSPDGLLDYIATWHKLGGMQAGLPLPRPQPDWAWFLDLDGTLIDLAPSPYATVIPDDLEKILRALRSATHGALALVSDRPTQQVHDLLKPMQPAVAGLHGLELVTPDGLSHTPRLPLPPIGRLRNQIEEAIEQIPGVELENKGLMLTIRFDVAPAVKTELDRIVREALAQNRGFVAIEGKQRFDLHPTSVNKGTAIRDFMSIPPFIGRKPLYAGDDRADEDAFKVVKEMGGIAIRVGSGGETEAAWTVDSPAAFRQWLSEAVRILRHDAP